MSNSAQPVSFEMGSGKMYTVPRDGSAPVYLGKLDKGSLEIARANPAAAHQFDFAAATQIDPRLTPQLTLTHSGFPPPRIAR
jgi:hypothetical protein